MIRCLALASTVALVLTAAAPFAVDAPVGAQGFKKERDFKGAKARPKGKKRICKFGFRPGKNLPTCFDTPPRPKRPR